MKIKRYKNRKLYANGTYITNRDLLGYVVAGQPFHVIDHRTKLDITREALASVLTGRLEHVSSETLIELIRRI